MRSPLVIALLVALGLGMGCATDPRQDDRGTPGTSGPADNQQGLTH